MEYRILSLFAEQIKTAKMIILQLNNEQLSSLIDNSVRTALKDFSAPELQKQTEENLLTVSEAADLLSLTPQTIYSKVSKREIPFMKRGKRLYFSRTDLLEYIKEGRRITHSEAKAASHSYLKQRNK